ncbi:MAG: hypothetical protein LBG47_10820 [Prevotellaceae bacterium]|nr:hypothetical protein [Prevotellaceae bacterium]
MGFYPTLWWQVAPSGLGNTEQGRRAQGTGHRAQASGPSRMGRHLKTSEAFSGEEESEDAVSVS